MPFKAGITQLAGASKDLSLLNNFPPIGDQGSENSCVSWATGYYVKTFQEAIEHSWDLSTTNWSNPSEAPDSNLDKIFSPDFIYHQVNDGENGGTYYADNIKVIIDNGCATWEEFPNDDTDFTTWPGATAWRQAPLYRGEASSDSSWNAAYYYLVVDSEEDIQILKTLLDNNMLITVSVNANYYYNMTADDVWNIDNYNGSTTNHANTMVGYLDD